MGTTVDQIVSSPGPKRDSISWFAPACMAIESAKCLQVEYEYLTCIVEVHRFGIGRAGEHILSGWQIHGPAPERVGWKLLNLDDAESLALTDIPSQAPRPDYRRGVRQFIGIICQL